MNCNEIYTITIYLSVPELMTLESSLERKDIMYNKLKLRIGYYKYYGVRTLLGLWFERKLRPFTEPSLMFHIAMYFDVHQHCYSEQNDCWCW